MDQQNQNTQPPIPPQPTPQLATNHPASGGASNDTKTIVTVLLLVFAWPVGVILMWVWTTWPKWLKILITLPAILGVLAIMAAIALIAINPAGQLKKAQMTQCISQCGSSQNAECINACMTNSNSLDSVQTAPTP